MKTLTMNKKMAVVLVVMTIIITVVFITFGRYGDTLSGVATASVAKPQTKLISGGDQKIVLDRGNVGTYRFDISNKEGNSISEVKMKYKLDITTNSGYTGTVKYSLYHCRSDGTYDENADKISVNQTGSMSGVTDNRMILPHTLEDTHHYILKFYPDTTGNFGFNVKVISEQTD